MSLTRKIVLSISLVALMAVSISLGDDLLWVKIFLVLPFLVALFWPSGREKRHVDPDGDALPRRRT